MVHVESHPNIVGSLNLLFEHGLKFRTAFATYTKNKVFIDIGYVTLGGNPTGWAQI